MWTSSADSANKYGTVIKILFANQIITIYKGCPGNNAFLSFSPKTINRNLLLFQQQREQIFYCFADIFSTYSKKKTKYYICRHQQKNQKYVRWGDNWWEECVKMGEQI